MLEKIKNLSIKNKIIFAVFALAFISILIFAILFLARVINLVCLCFAVSFSVLLISLANVFNVSIKEDKKMFIYNLVITILIFGCCVSFIVLLCLHPDALIK